MIFFTSDLHFGHEHIIQFSHRPFRNVTEMNRQLISNYNAVVQPEDTVYLLGDLSFQISVEKANALIAQLNGKKHLILGNLSKMLGIRNIKSNHRLRILILKKPDMLQAKKSNRLHCKTAVLPAL